MLVLIVMHHIGYFPTEIVEFDAPSPASHCLAIYKLSSFILWQHMEQNPISISEVEIMFQKHLF